MLTRLKGKPKRQRLKTYDLEWHSETCNVTCCGAYDSDTYTAYPTAQRFLEGELTSENVGKVFFAHWGARFDFQQLLPTIRANGARLEASLAGGGAIIAKIIKGSNTWVLADSASIARTSLAELGESIGRYKPACETDSASWAELKYRNREDCGILYDWLESAQDRLMGLGGSLRLTAASTALELFRRGFLREDIRTDRALNDYLRNFYFASRIEVFRPRPRGRLSRFDVNSMFPWAMLSKLPGSLVDIEQGRGKVNKRSYCLYECSSVTVPDSVSIPPLPTRGVDGRIFFPTGTFAGVYTETDIELLYETGGTCSVTRTFRFGLAHGFDSYAQTLYEIKKLATDPALRELAKILLNALYGKTAERNIKESLFILEPGAVVPNGARVISEAIDGLPRVYGVEIDRDVPHSHLPIAMAIVSLARAHLTRKLIEARDPCYCDTDCVDSSHKFSEGLELGDLKKEQEFTEAAYIAPKLYMIKHASGETCSVRKAVVKDGLYRIIKTNCEGYHVKSKGFSKLTDITFESLIGGSKLRISRMTGLAESIKEKPENISFEKGLNLVAWECPACFEVSDGSKECTCSAPLRPVTAMRPKRRVTGEDSTEPWSYSDIMSPWTPLDKA